ncbi:MAG: FAD-dependent oxidoreductase, partial [Nitrososphaerota archaeon]
MKKIVILGGGTGGTIVANVLARKISRDIEILVINDSPYHIYQPAFLYRALGEMLDQSKIMREERRLLNKNVKLIIDKA